MAPGVGGYAWTHCLWSHLGEKPGFTQGTDVSWCRTNQCLRLRLLIVNVREFNCQNLGAATMFCNGCMANCSAPGQCLLTSLRRNELWSPEGPGEPSLHINHERSQSGRAHTGRSNCGTFWQRQNSETITRSWGGGSKGEPTGGIQGVWGKELFSKEL